MLDIFSRTAVRRGIMVVCVLFISAFFSQPAYAKDPKLTIRDEAYKAKYVSQSLSDPIVVKQGETKPVTIRFKNVGTAVWENKGGRYISAYTMEPRDRDSMFRSPSWQSTRQTARMSTAVVRQGEIGEITIDIKAPQKTGEYTEEFSLAAENHSWLSGGYFYLKITVVSAKEQHVSSPGSIPLSADQAALGDGGEARARLVAVNKKHVEAPGGSSVQVVAIFRNIGMASWTQYHLMSNNPATLASVGETLTFADKNWQADTVVSAGVASVDPNKVLRQTFSFRTPVRAGTYTARFHLAIAGKQVADSVIEIPVTVTADAPLHYQEPVFDDSLVADAPEEKPRFDSEPRIRVGLWKPETYVQFRSKDDSYIIYAGEIQQAILPKNKLGVLKWENGTYTLSAPGIFVTSKTYIRLVPEHDPHAIFRLQNYKREVTWKAPGFFDEYRGAVEYRHTKDNTLYIINDLLFEDYVKGIGENGDSSPIEYLKAQTVAQRTYAYYIKEYSDKHDSRYFDVVATTGDQLYLGYKSEQIMPHFVEASEATRGYMATYDTDENSDTPSDVVITPYFGNTDGRTRSWIEVWGGKPKPWLVSVKANYDTGRRLFGHGVGMSQRDAAVRAQKEGLNWKDLVLYYYTGVEIEKIY